MQKFNAFIQQFIETVAAGDLASVAAWILKYKIAASSATEKSKEYLPNIKHLNKPKILDGEFADEYRFNSRLAEVEISSICLFALHIAAKCGSLEVVKYLLDECAEHKDLQVAINEALYFATKEAYYKILCWFKSEGRLLNKIQFQEYGAQTLNENHLLFWILTGKLALDQNTLIIAQHAVFDAEESHLAIARLLTNMMEKKHDKMSESLNREFLILNYSLKKVRIENLHAMKLCKQHTLHIAVEHKDWELFEWLCLSNGYTPFEEQKYLALQEWNYFGWKSEKFIKRSPIEIAVEKDSLMIVQWIFKHYPPVNLNADYLWRSICLAAEKGHLEIAAFLIASGVNVNAARKNTDAPLHYAAKRNRLDIVKLLVRSGADVNAVDREERTPLYVGHLHIEIVEFLCEAGANPNILPCEEKSLIELLYLVRDLMPVGHYSKAISILCKHGAKYSLLSGSTAINWCDTENSVILCQLLIENPFFLTNDKGNINSYIIDQLNLAYANDEKLKAILLARFTLTKRYKSVGAQKQSLYDLIFTWTVYAENLWEMVKCDIDLFFNNCHPLFANSREFLNSLLTCILISNYVSHAGTKKIAHYLAQIFQDEYFYKQSPGMGSNNPKSGDGYLDNITISILLLLRFSFPINYPPMVLNLNILVGNKIRGNASGIDLKSLIDSHCEVLLVIIQDLKLYCRYHKIISADIAQSNMIDLLLHKVLAQRASRAAESVASTDKSEIVADIKLYDLNTNVPLTCGTMFIVEEYQALKHHNAHKGKDFVLTLSTPPEGASNLPVLASSYAQFFDSCIQNQGAQTFDIISGYELLKVMSSDNADMHDSLYLAKCILLKKQKCLIDEKGSLDKNNFKWLSQVYERITDLDGLVKARFYITRVYVLLMRNISHVRQLTNFMSSLSSFPLLIYSDIDAFFNDSHELLIHNNSLPKQFYKFLLSIEYYNLSPVITKLFSYIGVKHYQKISTLIDLDGKNYYLKMAAIFFLKSDVDFTNKFYYYIFRSLLSSRVILTDEINDFNSLVLKYSGVILEILKELKSHLDSFIAHAHQDEDASPFLHFEIYIWELLAKHSKTTDAHQKEALKNNDCATLIRGITQIINLPRNNTDTTNNNDEAVMQGNTLK